jgi:hypothetical protein
VASFARGLAVGVSPPAAGRLIGAQL